MWKWRYGNFCFPLDLSMSDRAVCPEGVIRGGGKDFESDSATVHA